MASALLENFNQISEKLYIGDYFASINYKALIDNNITHIVVCGEELVCRYPQEFSYLHFKISDRSSTSIREYFEEAFQFINEGMKRGSVLVHCAQARSRSVSIIISYLMKSRRLKFKKAMDLMKKYHPQADPNPGFQKQLLNYEQEIFPKRSTCFLSLF